MPCWCGTCTTSLLYSSPFSFCLASLTWFFSPCHISFTSHWLCSLSGSTPFAPLFTFENGIRIQQPVVQIILSSHFYVQIALRMMARDCWIVFLSHHDCHTACKQLAAAVPGLWRCWEARAAAGPGGATLPNSKFICHWQDSDITKYPYFQKILITH